jgi:hypothetical protein
MNAVIKLNQNGAPALTTQELQEAKKQILEMLPNATKISRESFERQLEAIDRESKNREFEIPSEPKEVKVEVTELSLLKELVETNKKISSWVTFMGAVVLIQIIIGVIVGFILMP